MPSQPRLGAIQQHNINVQPFVLLLEKEDTITPNKLKFSFKIQRLLLSYPFNFPFFNISLSSFAD